MVRILIIVIYLPICIYAFSARLIYEIRSALWFAWSDVKIEHDDMRKAWIAKKFSKEDFQ